MLFIQTFSTTQIINPQMKFENNLEASFGLFNNATSK
jgi:hypothetical protein